MFRRVVAPGVEMRLAEETDAPALFALTEKNRARLRQWLPWVDHTHAVDDVRRFLREQALPQHHSQGGVHAVIVVDGAVAGSIGCRPIDRANRVTSIGYWLDADFEGRGVMTLCCREFVDCLFTDEGLHRVEIRCATGNRRSCAIARRLGFTLEGTLRELEWVSGRFVDLHTWSLLEGEWRAGQARRPAPL